MTVNVYLNVPLGHGFGTDVPTGQKKPEGHRNPPGLTSGEGSVAPPTQTWPAAHGPLGNALPSNKFHPRMVSFSFHIQRREEKSG